VCHVRKKNAAERKEIRPRATVRATTMETADAHSAGDAAARRARHAQAMMLTIGLARVALLATIAAALVVDDSRFGASTLAAPTPEAPRGLGDPASHDRAALLHVVLGTACAVGNNVVYSATRRTSASSAPFASVLATLYYVCAAVESAALFLGGATYAMFAGDAALGVGAAVVPTSVLLLVMCCTYTCTGHVMNSGASPPDVAMAYRRRAYVGGRCVNGWCLVTASVACLGTLFRCSMTVEARGVACLALVCVWIATDAFTLDVGRDVGDVAIDDHVLLVNLLDAPATLPRRVHSWMEVASVAKYVALAVVFLVSTMVRAQSGCAAMGVASAVGCAAIGLLLLPIGALSAVSTVVSLRSYGSTSARGATVSERLLLGDG